MSLEEKEKELYNMGSKKSDEVVNLSTPQKLIEEDISSKEEELQGGWNTGKSLVSNDFEESSADRVVNKIGFFSKITFWILIVVVLAGSGFLYYFINEYSKSKDLSFDVKAPNRVMIAKPFEISINLENKSVNTLKHAKILISLPDGVISLDNRNSDMQTYEDSIGDLKPNAVLNKKYKFVILKDEQSIKKFDIKFSYVPQNLNTRFEKNESIEISADQPAVTLNLTTPQKVFNGENFDMSVSYQNISDFDFDNARLKIIYPGGFKFKEASATSSISNNIWNFERISKVDGEKNITIKGALQGVDQSFFEVKSQFFVKFNNKEYLINEKSSRLSIASSPLSLSILANNSLNYVAGINDTINYQISYRNNTDVGLNDVVIKIKLSGEMFDFSTLQSNGNFDSVTNTMTWNAGNVSGLRLLAQNDQGTVDFTIRTKKDFPIKRISDKNFILKLNGEIDSPTVPYNVSSDRTVGLANFETKIKGYAEINALLEVVKGPTPPKENKATAYNVRLFIKNYSTDLKDIKINTVLESGVKWINIVKSTGDTMPLYNDRTGEIEWQIPSIPATKGVIGKPTEASFQVEGTPNITQLGQQFPVLGSILFTATDAFTGLILNSQTNILKTDLRVVN